MNKSKPRSADPHPRKEASLPKVIRLAEQGLSLREIAKQVRVSKSTIANWLREAPPKPAAVEPLDPAKEIRETIEMFKSMRKAAYDEWHASKADKQVRVEEESGPANSPGEKVKKTVRTETRTANTAYFKTVMDAQDRIEAQAERLAALEGLPSSPADRLASLSDEDLENLSDEDLDYFNDDELRAMDLRLRAKHEREGKKFDRPVLTNEEIRNMTDEELARQIKMRTEPRGEEPPAPATATQQPPPGDAAPQEILVPPAEPEPAKTVAAGAGDASSASLATAAKADPPPLTAAEQEEAERRKKAERKRYLDRFKDPNYCAYRWDGFRR